jgi:tetratricopeptide (TPR) repeat protein
MILDIGCERSRQNRPFHGTTVVAVLVLEAQGARRGVVAVESNRTVQPGPEADDRGASVAGFAATAERYLAEDRLDAAREVCVNGVSQAPWYAPGHIVMAKICIECGDHEAAEQSLRNALRLDPMNSVAHTLLGQVLLLKGDSEAAAKALDEALFLCPSNHLAAELLRRATGDEQAPEATRQTEAAERPQPTSDEEEAAALRAMPGVEGVLIATRRGLASSGTMGQGNENDEALASGAATAMQTWARSRALGVFGAPRWAVVTGERGQLIVAEASHRMVIARLARRLRLGRVIPSIEAACRNLSS